MANTYQKMKKKDAVALIQEYPELSWEWFLEPMRLKEPISGETYFKLFLSKFNEKNYLSNIKGKSLEIPAKRFRVEKVKIISEKDRKEIKNKGHGPLSVDEAKIFNLFKQGYSSEQIIKNNNISSNKLSRIKSKLIERSLVEIEYVPGEHSKQNKYKYYHILNLNPFFEFCEQINNNLSEPEKISFTRGEKRILELLYNHENSYIRSQVYLEYKNIDFLNAILKFHVKHFYLPYETTKTRIKSKLNINLQSIKWIMSLNEEDLFNEFYELKEKYPSKNINQHFIDLNKIKNWNTYLTILLSEKNINYTEDDVNFYGVIYKTFQAYNKDIMSNLGWKLIKFFAFKNT